MKSIADLSYSKELGKVVLAQVEDLLEVEFWETVNTITEDRKAFPKAWQMFGLDEEVDLEYILDNEFDNIIQWVEDLSKFIAYDTIKLWWEEYRPFIESDEEYSERIREYYRSCVVEEDRHLVK